MAGSSSKLESLSGTLLMGAAALAIVLDNSALAGLYDKILTVPVQIRVGEFDLHKPLLLWINDGLMAVFFLFVGLEIKREALEGQLSRREHAVLPLFAALGGVLAPSIIFTVINWSSDSTLEGWAIPAATDIAFALGILAILGSRVPISIKIFLTAVAIVDDLAAIVIIALFYTSDLSWTSLGFAAAFTGVLVALNRRRVTTRLPYFVAGACLWVSVLKSGVHATLAGVILAFAIPLRVGDSKPAVETERELYPWTALFVMPLFAFANAGVSLKGISFDDLLAPLPLGIALGLFFGKQLGVFIMTWVPIRLGLARKPRGAGWIHVYGASLLAGVGFTMSLFIGTLAFSTPEYSTQVRVGVLSGSILSGIAGFLVLRAAGIQDAPEPKQPARSTKRRALTAITPQGVRS